MISLIILAILLLALWVFGVVERNNRARFMSEWVHVPLFAFLLVALMILISLVLKVT